MKLQLSQITTGMLACALASPALASPTSKQDSPVSSWGLHPGLLRRAFSDWGQGHYGGAISEITWEVAKELERIQQENSGALTTDTASSTIMAVPTTTETATAEPTTTEESTTWSTLTLTATVTVTQLQSTATAALTAAPARRAKREELLIGPEPIGGADENAGDLELDQLVKELNSFFTMDAIALGDSCIPVTEFENKICIGDVVAICGEKSWAWEVDMDCGIDGLVCGAVKAEDFVHGDWGVDIQCLDGYLI